MAPRAWCGSIGASDPSIGRLTRFLRVALAVTISGWLVGAGKGMVVNRRASLPQARCVAACLEQLVAGSSQDVEVSCNQDATCTQCLSFCLELTTTRFSLTDQGSCLTGCGSGAHCTIACSFFMSSDTARDAPTATPQAKWNASARAVSLSWQPSILIPTDVYLVCMSMAVPCSVTASTDVFYLVIGHAQADITSSSASVGSLLQVAQVSSAGSLGFSQPSFLLPGAISGINVSRSFYYATFRRTFVNITWNHLANDGFTGQRLFSIVVEHQDTSIPRGNDACTRRIERTSQANYVLVEMLGGGLDHNCEYDVTVTPILASGSFVNSSSSVLAGHIIRGNIVPPPDRVTRLCQFYDIKNDFNLTLTAGPVGSQGMTLTWGWWSFNRTLPVYDFVSSMGPFNIVLMDSYFSRMDAALQVSGIHPVHVNADNSVVSFLNISVHEGVKYAYITFHLYTSAVILESGRYESICTSPVTYLTSLNPPQTPSTVPSGVESTVPTDSLTSSGGPTEAAESESNAVLTTIVAPIVAALVLVAAIGLVVCFQCRKGKKAQDHSMMPASAETSAGMGNSDNGHMTGSTDIWNGSIAPDGPMDIVRPPPDIWEVPRENVHLLEQLGRGAFGQVCRAQLDNPPHLGVDRCEVAVKKLFDTANSHDKTDLLDEISRMKDIAAAGGHRYLVRFVACCTQDDPIYLMSECIAHGSLKDLMQKTRQAAASDPYLHSLEVQGLPRIALSDGHIHPAEACDFARQIASGMAFLTHMRMIHRDLAARNVLVDRGKVLKVSDFGMTRDVYEDPDEVYIKTTGGKVPIRWMALEALTLRTYSSESDMWSFGVLLWEIATLAKFPYSGIQNRELISELRGGRRMEKPRGCPDELYQIMLQCWNEDPERRPRFADIVKVFEELPQRLETKKKSNRPSLRGLRPYSFPRIANLRNNLRSQPPPEPAPSAPAPAALPAQLSAGRHLSSTEVA